jgi:hypothetical protein
MSCGVGGDWFGLGGGQEVVSGLWMERWFNLRAIPLPTNHQLDQPTPNRLPTELNKLPTDQPGGSSRCRR